MEKQLPKNWVEDSLGNLVIIERGGSPRPIENYITDSEDGLNWIKISDATASDKYIYKTKQKIKPEGLYKTRYVKEGDFILSNSMSFGRPYIMKTDGCIHDGWLALKEGKVKIFNNDFLYYLLSSSFVFNQFDSLASGSTVRNLNKDLVSSVVVKIPPLPEQHRIVAKLDALFAQLETIKTSMANIPLLLKDFRQQVLTQAVAGKLTEEWRKGKKLGNSETIIKKIVQKRINDFELKCKKAKENNERKPLTPEYFNYSEKDLKTHSIDSWFLSPVGFLCDCIVPGRDKPKSFTGTIPWITTPDLISDYITDKNGRLFLSEIEIDEVKAKIIPINSVVISIVGRFGISCVTKVECVINQQLHAYLPSDLVIPEYLMFHIKTQENFMNDLSSSTTIAYINKTKANSIPINVPSLQEQQEIVRRVESLFAKADTIEQQYKDLKASIDNLPQAILHKAFKGELTEQLASDGDARELLKQIQELKNSAVKPKKSTAKKVKKYPENKEVLGMVAED